MSEIKDSYIRIRINQSDKKILQYKAQEYGLSVSEYMREVALRQRITNKNYKKKLLMNIIRVGNNINQIAKYINTFNDDNYKLQLLVLLDEIHTHIMEIHKHDNECI